MKNGRNALAACGACAALLLAVAESHAQTTISPTGQWPDASWYSESFIHAHMSVGFHKANFDMRDVRTFRDQVEAVRPDAIQFHGGGGKAASVAR